MTQSKIKLDETQINLVSALIRDRIKQLKDSGFPHSADEYDSVLYRFTEQMREVETDFEYDDMLNHSRPDVKPLFSVANHLGCILDDTFCSFETRLGQYIVSFCQCSDGTIDLFTQCEQFDYQGIKLNFPSEFLITLTRETLYDMIHQCNRAMLEVKQKFTND